MSDTGLTRAAAGIAPVAGMLGPGHPVYTCPMHPEVRQASPGACPKCGMALELETPTGPTDEAGSTELHDMTRRLWVGAVLALPVFLLAMAHLIPVLGRQAWVTGEAARWLQFALTAPVVCWAGWPFFTRGWRSVMTHHLNMFTLIATGVGVAFVFSTVGDAGAAPVPPHGRTWRQGRHLL